MVEQKFIDKIEDLRHNTYSRITSLQKELCPMIKKIYLHYQFEYWYDGYKYNLWEEDTHVYACNELPYCYDNGLRNTVFIDTLDNLVKEDVVWPFIMFINGQAIKWSDITVIHDYDYTYLKIGNYGPNESFYTDIVVFPIPSKKIRYGEDSDILIGVDNPKGFYFNEDGNRVEDPDFDNIVMRLEILDDNIYYKEVNIFNLENNLTFEDLPDGYIPTLDNILCWDSNGLFVSSGATDNFKDWYNSAYNTFKVNKSSTTPFTAKYAILLYNTKHSKSQAYLYSKEDLNKTAIKTLIRNTEFGSEDWEDIIDPVIAKFDFDHSRELDYDTNLNNSIKYVTNYDFRLWKDSFTEDIPIQSYTYTGREFKQLADNKGYVHYSRKHSDNIQDVAMMFVNSKLYEYSIDISYTTNTINLPIFGITDDDHIEIVLFNKCNNLILDIVVPDKDTSVYIHPSYELEDSYIMSEECPDAYYSVPDSEEGRKQYIVDLTYEKVSEGYYKITFDNDYYYGKELKIVPKRQFRYYRYKQKDNQYRVILPTQFNYCHDPNRYLIFINGIKIDRTEYTITIMNKNRPFEKLVLYLSTILDAGDYVDIFYIPEVLEEKYHKSEMMMGGYINLNETNNYPKTYPLSKYTTFVFVNGKKVNPLDIKDIDMNRMLINVDKYLRDKDGNIIYDGEGNPKKSPFYIDSIYNVSYLTYLEGDKYISGYLQGLYDQVKDDYDPEKIDFTVTAMDNWKVLIEKLLKKYKGGTVILSGNVVGTILTFDDDAAEVKDTTLNVFDGTDIGYDGLTKLYGTIYPLDVAGSDYKSNFAGLKSILYDVIVDYYLVRAEANTGEPFAMDFERDYWEPYTVPDTEEVIKTISLFPDHDKLLDYITSDYLATAEDVQEGYKFIPVE
jgi:hypothetical protein